MIRPRISLILAALALAVAAPAAADAPVVPLTKDVRAALEPLGPGVVGEALPAAPINEPSRLRHLEPGTWRYQVVAGAHQSQEQTVRVERVTSGDQGATWEVVTDKEEIQQLKVTTDHEVVKLSQSNERSDRIVVYRPGLVLETGMSVGESKTVKSRVATHKLQRPEEVEFEGQLEYTTRYIGAYRVTTPAGEFDARLLEHRYAMTIGPAKANYHSYGFYADDVGNVAEVSEESVSALLVYRHSSNSARVLLSAPPR